MTRIIFLACLLLVAAGCNNEAADSLQSGKVMNIFGLEGRWVGPVTPDAVDCGKRSTGVMSVGRSAFVFDPFQGTTVIHGTVSDAGMLDGRLSRPGSGQQMLLISFAGVASRHDGEPESIDGQMLSGRCSWTVKLKRG